VEAVPALARVEAEGGGFGLGGGEAELGEGAKAAGSLQLQDARAAANVGTGECRERCVVDDGFEGDRIGWRGFGGRV
jgi:hypothetical protein